MKSQAKAESRVGRDLILAAAERVFAKHGIGGLSVRTVAKEAACSTIGVYTHFGGKDGILEALYMGGFEQLGQRMNEVRDPEDPVGSLDRAVAAYLEFARTHPDDYALMFDVNGAVYEPSEAARKAARSSFMRLCAIVEDRVGPKAAVPTAQHLWALVHGMTTLREHIGGGQTDPQWNARIQRTVALAIGATASSTK